ncbi:DinB family protein [Cytobacillus sp. FJAT-54145]|uniref:DinB family protein n=1 Tax=Cytobacillus spartinae TaxID=3299023 RepID=A0ABW6KHA6_9BACI
MLKQEIIAQYEELNEWFNSLIELEDEKWFAPIDIGKWSVAAVIGHLLFWDKHSFEKRYPHFKSGAQLEPYPDFQEFNNAAEKYAESGITRDQLIDELLQVRIELKNKINSWEDEELDTAFFIGNHSISIRQYIVDFIEHDHYHKRKVEKVIK